MEQNELIALRQPFEPCDISKLPKPTKRQTDEVKQDFKKGVRCTDCGGWHHPQVVHLDYVGHAATTNRLLDVDPQWNWEFLSTSDNGQPVFDNFGGLWIKLTVLGVTRKGYGDADGKQGPNAIKEAIGDAIRNAAMRFGVALELWHKGELSTPADAEPRATEAEDTATLADDQLATIRNALGALQLSEDDLLQVGGFQCRLDQIHADKYENIMGWLQGQQQQEGMGK